MVPLNVCNDLIRMIPNSQALLAREKGAKGVVKNEVEEEWNRK